MIVPGISKDKRQRSKQFSSSYIVMIDFKLPSASSSISFASEPSVNILTSIVVYK